MKKRFVYIALLLVSFLFAAACGESVTPLIVDEPAEEIIQAPEADPAEPETEQTLPAGAAENNRPRWAYGRTRLWDFAESDDPLELAVYNTVWPYVFVIGWWRNLEYPDFYHPFQYDLLSYVMFGLLRGYFDSPFIIEEREIKFSGFDDVIVRMLVDFWDEQEQTQIIPREIFDAIIARHFYNPAFDYDLLIEQGFMLPDGSAYKIHPFWGGSGEGRLFVGDLSTCDGGMVIFRLDAEFDVEEPLAVFFTLAPTNYNFLQIVAVRTE